VGKIEVRTVLFWIFAKISPDCREWRDIGTGHGEDVGRGPGGRPPSDAPFKSPVDECTFPRAHGGEAVTGWGKGIGKEGNSGSVCPSTESMDVPTFYIMKEESLRENVGGRKELRHFVAG